MASSNDAMDHSIWAKALEKKRPALEHAKISLALDITSLERFEAALDNLTAKYAEKTGVRAVKDVLAPQLEHLVSFSEAVTSAAQVAPYGGAIWGGLLLMIESTCRFSRSLDEIMTEISELQGALPQFSEYAGLYSNDPGLQFCLLDLFEDYIDFCICVVNYTRKRPAVNIIRNIMSSSRIKGLENVKKSIAKNKERFAQRAEAAHRRNSERNYRETVKLKQIAVEEFESLHLATSPESNASRSPPASSPLVSRVASYTTPKTQASHEPFLHTVAWKRNTIFTGREAELQQLHQYLSTPGQFDAPRSCAIHGIGGVGKTQLALEYTYRCRQFYQAIFWLRTENSIELLESFSSIGNKVGIIDDVNEGRRVSRILNWLESTDKKWLLIMDNLETLDTVATIWPKVSLGGGSIIITTQKPCDSLKWADFDIPLRPFGPTDGSKLLLVQVSTGAYGDVTKKEEAALAMEISNNVGGLPLWINALGGFVAQSQCTLLECLDIYKASFRSLDEGTKGGGWIYEKTPTKVFDLAFSRLSEDAKTLLYILAFLNPDGVPESMLSIDNVERGELAVLAKTNRQRFFSAIANLRDSQLIKREHQRNENHLTTHRSIQTAVLHRLDSSLQQRQISFGHACTILRRVLPRPSPLQQPESNKWPLIQMYLPQLLSLEKAFLRAQPPIEGSMEVALLLSDVGLNIWDRGLAEDAKSLLLTAERVLDGIGCEPMAMERSDLHVLLGIITDTIGITQRVEGLRHRQRANEIRKNYLDSIPPEQLTLDEEIRYYNTITDLACSYQQFNRYGDVERICTTIIAKYRSWGTEEAFPYEFAKYYHHMAFVLVHRGDTMAAAKYAKHATHLLELGSFGLLAVLFRFDCATIYFQNGQAELAISEHNEVLQHRLLKLGRANQMTIQSHLTLGVIYYFTNDFTNAELHVRAALKQSRKSSSTKEIVIRAKFYMSRILKAQQGKGSYAEVERLAQEAKASLKDLLRLDFPDFLKDRDEDDPILYDYLAPWTNRIVVEQQVSGQLD
ncbi:hypothetical protein J3F84DRAFT_408260 [Trichoderma pleuroticola]